MAKTHTYQDKVITQKVSVVTEIITCDKCGTELDPDGEDEFANVLEIYLNADQCVNDRVRMDLCGACLLPMWQKICKAIGADPDAGELRIGQD